MVALVVYYIRIPNWGRFVTEAMGFVFFEDVNLPLGPLPFETTELAQEIIDSWKHVPDLYERCVVEPGVL